jgi:signal transduction histidine kinase
MLKDKYVLTVDDSDTIRTYLRNLFIQQGAIVDGAATGQEGLKMCALRQYDLILLDLLLPDMDGIELLKNIRATNDFSTIVMITGHGGVKSAIAAVQLGADGYIEKQDITATIRDHAEFLYALEQASSQRAGLAAQKQLEQVRADFYSMVTHDLRNPTTLILMAGEMLFDGSAEPLTAKQKEFVTLINDAANRLILLINDYLDFAKIDAGYLRLERGDVELQKVVESSAQFARLQAQIRRQTLTLDLPPDPVHAEVDAERLKQVFDNLLSNAIKYTPEGGQITLEMRVEGEHAIFRISDTGMGIPAALLPTLFTKYHRVSSQSIRGINGTGLGLLIVKEITEAHQGTVGAESQGVPGKGTTFAVSIPLHPQPRTSQTGPESSPPAEQLPSALPTLDFSQDRELRLLFFEETHKQIATLQETLAGLSSEPDNRVLLNKARMASHTLKGNASAMDAITIYDLAGEMDRVFQQASKGEVSITPTQLNDLYQRLERIVSIVRDEQGV